MADDPDRKPDEPDSVEGDKPDDGLDLAAEVEKWKALSKKHEGRSKEGLAAIEELAQLKEKDKTELQKATDRVAELEKELAQERTERMREAVGRRKSLTDTQVRRLQGTTEEELEADADELMAAFKPPDPPDDDADPSRQGNGRRQGTPTPRLKPGAVQGAEPVETDPRKLAAAVDRSAY